MKTALYTPCYLDGKDISGSWRHKRMRRWLEHHKKMGLGDLWLCDNESDAYDLSYILDNSSIPIHYMRFPHLPKRGNNNGVDYDYCWRALWFMRAMIAMGYQKIIFLDNDAFILSQRLLDFVQGLKNGWTAFRIPKYGFPSAEFQILCEDAFPTFLEYTKGNFMDQNGITMEDDLPFTCVMSSFKGDRYGEDRIPQDDSMDFYCQAPTDVPLEFHDRNSESET